MKIGFKFEVVERVTISYLFVSLNKYLILVKAFDLDLFLECLALMQDFEMLLLFWRVVL